MDTLLWLGIGAVAGAGGVAAVWLAYLWVVRRPRPSHEPSVDPSVPDPIVPGPKSIVPTPEVVRSGTEVDPPPSAQVADLARLSERIVLQLARLGRIEPDAPVRRERTQQGLAETTTSNQSAVSKVLRRLVAAEIIAEERRHIVGVSQRMKAYSLTHRGELLAREVARRHHVDLLPSRGPPGTGDRSNPRRSSRP